MSRSRAASVAVLLLGLLASGGCGRVPRSKRGRSEHSETYQGPDGDAMPRTDPPELSSNFDEFGPYEVGALVNGTFGSGNAKPLPRIPAEQFSIDGIWGRGACALQPVIIVTDRSAPPLTVTSPQLNGTAPLVAAPVLGHRELPLPSLDRAELVGWVTCRRGVTDPFFTAQVAGAAVIGCRTTLAAASPSWATYAVAWSMGREAGSGRGFSLVVRFWGDGAASFGRVQGCAARAGARPEPGGHVGGSPLPLRVAAAPELEPPPQCRGTRLPAHGAWVRAVEDLGEETGAAAVEGTGTAAVVNKAVEERGMFDRRDIVLPRPCVPPLRRSPSSPPCEPSKARWTAEAPFEYAWAPRGCSLTDLSPSTFIHELAAKLAARASSVAARGGATQGTEAVVGVGGGGHRGVGGRRGDGEAGDVFVRFVGDSTLHYLCKVLATALSGHTLVLRNAKFSDKASKVVSLCRVCCLSECVRVCACGHGTMLCPAVAARAAC